MDQRRRPLGFHLVLACPDGYVPDREILKRAWQARAENRIVLTHDPIEAAEGADVVNTDVWVSMGQETEREARLEAFHGFQVNRELLRERQTGRHRHALPAGPPGEEIISRHSGRSRRT